MSGWDIQQAIYIKLTGATSVTSLVPAGSIVDFGPRENDASAIYPYVSFGGLILSENDTDSTTGFDMAIRIHTYSDQGGSRQCRQIQDAIYGVLHLAELTVSGYNPIITYREDTQIMQTSRGAFHGVCEYRSLLEKT
jgi:hypothetical protein